MKFISVVFHPLLMATYCSITLYLWLPEIYSPVPLESVPNLILIIFTTTFAIPGISILFLLFTKRITHLDITNKEERALPFLSIAAFYGATTYMFYTKIRLPDTLLAIMITVTILIVIIFLVSFKMKISVHAAGIWGTAGLLSAIAINYGASTNALIGLSVVFLAAGLTTASRLYLGRHTPLESWSGAFTGYLLCFISLMLFG